MILRGCRKLYDYIKIIGVCRLDVFGQAAGQTAVGDDRFRTALGGADGLHHAPALGLAVARVDINVAAPEAVRAVVGVAIADDLRSAVAADKIFFSALE